MSYQIVVCAGIVPDPLQSLQPMQGPTGPALRNEMMLPAVLDPWAWHSLFEAAHLAKANPGSQVTLVSISPKAKLQQVMMSVAQKVPFGLTVADSPANGFSDSFETARILAETIEAQPGLDKGNLFIFGGWQSASRGAGSTLQMVGERLGIVNQFQGVDVLEKNGDGSFIIKERIEGGGYLVSTLSGPPAVLGWATGNLPEPPNNPQVGMQNMQKVMPAIQQGKPVQIGAEGVEYRSVELPKQVRETRIVKDTPVEDMAREIVEWIRG